MDHRQQNRRIGDLPYPADPKKLGNPIDFIAADHMYEREICAILDQVVAGTLPDPARLRSVQTFFREVLPFHLADEEQDLFPMMIRRCDPEDRIDVVVRKLQFDHAHAGTETPQVTDILERFITDPSSGADAEAREFLSSYTDHARRHLIVENAIILPIARARLTPDDLDTLLISMLKRRGLYRPEDGSDAE